MDLGEAEEDTCRAEKVANDGFKECTVELFRIIVHKDPLNETYQ